MTRFQFRGWDLHSLASMFLSVFFNKLVISITWDEQASKHMQGLTAYGICDREEYPGESK